MTLTLYHGTTSVCAAKVRLAFEEKGMAYDGPILDLQRGDQHDPDYVKLNPNAVIPTLVHNDRVIVESTVICHYIDEAFDGPPLMPSEPLERAKARVWMKKVDEYLHPGVGVLTFATANRKALLSKTPEEREAHFNRMPDPARRARQQQVVEHGLAAPMVVDAVKAYDRELGRLEETLGDAPYIAGRTWSLADAALTPYINRLSLLAIAPLWERTRPRITAWFERIKERPSFDGAISRFFTDADAERFDLQEDVWAKVETILAAA